ncbi:MAG: energy transducer TonB [Pseudomonadota bacterium]
MMNCRRAGRSLHSHKSGATMKTISAIIYGTAFALVSMTAFAESDRGAQPIEPPVPKYPVQAAMAGMSGMCDALFDVDQTGNILNLRASCSNLVFCHEVIRAMSEVAYAPKIVNGEAVPRYGVVFPLEFTIAGGGNSTGYGDLKPCEQSKKAVS